ncbi:MAG: DUF1501 domain-containing protein [Verrucomicrobiales bacterium]|nr:DUF1501 domain-containing protein [Verrucomicrobiales bacterium]
MYRREFLYGVNGGLGALAFHSMLRAEEKSGSLVPKVAHFPKAKAKRCIFLYMAGGPSHIDTFDPKPKLRELHLKKFKRQSKFLSAMGSGERYYVQSPFSFVRAGKSGIEMCEHWQHLAGVADELCVYRGCMAESINHPTANYHMNTGNRFGGDPAIGSWVNYGLGTENQNLPGYVVLPEVAYPQGGAANWSNGFLPPHFQGTTLRSKGSPILDLHPPKGVTREAQRSNLDLLAGFNLMHAKRHPSHEELASRMESYELAYRMQMEVPGILDLGKENQSTRESYGLNDQRTEEFGRRLLLARRLLENGVRFVQVYTAGWDSHDYINRSHRERIRSVDKPIASLIKDLKDRGLLDETLIVWCGEFGRTPDNGKRGGGERLGRDHNKNAMAVWMAGGGVNAGHVVGATDEIGESATEVVHPVRDLHVTILKLLGLDDNKLTYFHGGRFKQLSQTGGEVISELIG